MKALIFPLAGALLCAAGPVLAQLAGPLPRPALPKSLQPVPLAAPALPARPALPALPDHAALGAPTSAAMDRPATGTPLARPVPPPRPARPSLPTGGQ